MKSYRNKLISLWLSLNFIFPSSLFAAVLEPRSAVILPIIEDKNSVESQFTVELAQSLARDLGAKVNMVNASVLKQTNKGVNTGVLSEDYLSLYKNLSAARGKYTLAGNASEAITALDTVAGEITHHTDYNRELSKLYETTQLTKAWILYQTGKRSESGAVIRTIAAVKAEGKIETLGYPAGFKKFIIKESQKQNSASLFIESNPKSVDVFVNGIFAGDSSQTILLPAGDYNLSLAATGRRTVNKSLKLADGASKHLKTNLAWVKRGDTSPPVIVSQDPFEQLSLSSALNQGVHADKIVFLSVKPFKNGYQVAAKVFDQNYHQPLATLKYPRLVRNIQTEAANLKAYLAKNITLYLEKPANELWKGDFDQSIKLDDRVALRPREPLYRKPGFWVAVGGVVIGGTVLGLVLANGGTTSSGGTGSVSVDLGGFRGVTR